MRRIYLYLTLAFGVLALFPGCGSDPQDIDLDSVEIDLKVERLDRDMAEAAKVYEQGRADSVSVYLKHFARHKAFIADWMFMGDETFATDSVVTVVMHDFMQDPQGRALLDSVETYLGGNFDPEALLTDLFKRYKYYFPQKALPVVVTYVDGYPPSAEQGLDQIFISPRFLGIGLHYLLGPTFKFYPPDLPKYIRRRCNPEHLPALVAHKIADVSIPPPDISTNPVLLDFVIHAGIKQYFVDRLLGPQVEDSLKLFYTSEQMEWANFYEAKAYKDMLDELYEIDSELLRRYLDDSPFTSQLNRGSAPRLGHFLGWKIVSKYMEEHPDASLDGLVKRTDYRKIFQDARYRPVPAQG